MLNNSMFYGSHMYWIAQEIDILPERQMGERDKKATRGGKTLQARAITWLARGLRAAASDV